MATVSEALEGDVAVGADADPRDGGVQQADPQPRLRRDLEGAAHKVSDHVGVAHHQLVGVLLLVCSFQ